jgi:hypothetical protein
MVVNPEAAIEGARKIKFAKPVSDRSLRFSAVMVEWPPNPEFMSTFSGLRQIRGFAIR